MATFVVSQEQGLTWDPGIFNSTQKIDFPYFSNSITFTSSSYVQANVIYAIDFNTSAINFTLNAPWSENFEVVSAIDTAITPEEADRRLQETRRRQHKNAIMRKRAVKKGKRLLVSILTELQQHEYAKHGRFTVIGEDGKVFVLRKSGTVHELGVDGHAAYSHCIHLPYSYIDEDTLISLKLLLETNVKEFRRIANTSKLHGYSAPLAMPNAA